MKISDHDMKEFEKLFAPALEWLDFDVYKKNPKPGFNMHRYDNKINAIDFSGKECEHTVCIIGFLAVHHGFNPDYIFGLQIIRRLAAKFDFEDTEMAVHVLESISMVSDNDGISLVYDLECVKPYQVAAVIRHFLKSRKIKWKKFLTKDQLYIPE